MSTRYLNQRQLADRWQMSTKTLERWRWLGRVLPYMKISNRVLYDIQDIERFEAERRQQVTPGVPGPLERPEKPRPEKG